MKVIFFLLFFASTSIAYAGECLSVDEVKATLAYNLDSLESTINYDTNLPVCSTIDDELLVKDNSDAAECVPRTSVLEGIVNMAWSEEKGLYTSGTFFQWECAASADCWISLEYSCDGSVSAIPGGED